MTNQQLKDKVVHGMINFIVTVVSWGFVFYLLLEALCK
jgi:hypothetical protein